MEPFLLIATEKGQTVEKKLLFKNSWGKFFSGVRHRSLGDIKPGGGGGGLPYETDRDARRLA